VTSLYPVFLKTEVNALHDPVVAVYGYDAEVGIPFALTY